LDRGTHRPCCSREDRKEGVAFRLHLGPATGSDRLSKNPVVAKKELGVGLPGALKEAR
jgi:hypothetical protein